MLVWIRNQRQLSEVLKRSLSSSSNDTPNRVERKGQSTSNVDPLIVQCFKVYPSCRQVPRSLISHNTLFVDTIVLLACLRRSHREPTRSAVLSETSPSPQSVASKSYLSLIVILLRGQENESIGFNVLEVAVYDDVYYILGALLIVIPQVC